jgi:hypothetical protein
MLEAGIPFSVVATIMGWSASTTVRMANRYGHIGQVAQRRAVDAHSDRCPKPLAMTTISIFAFRYGFSRDPVKGANDRFLPLLAEVFARKAFHLRLPLRMYLRARMLAAIRSVRLRPSSILRL